MLAVSALTFAVSMLPIFILSVYDRPAIDDYGYADYSHPTWVATHSVWQTLMSQFEKVHDIYFSWQGTWFTVFLFGLHPATFSFKAYALVPWIMIICLSASFAFFMHEILVNRMGMRRIQCAVISLLTLFLFFNFEPDTTCTIYWWVGCCHYVIPLSLCFMAIALTSRFIRLHRKRQIVWLCVCMTLIGGSNYLAAFFAPLTMLLLVIMAIMSDTSAGKTLKESIKSLLPIVLPVCFEVAGMLISVLAPGNFVRSDMDMGIDAYFSALISAFTQGTADIGTTSVSKPVTICVLAILVAYVIVVFAEKSRNEKNVSNNAKFAHPVFFVIYTYVSRCLIHWPAIFSGGEVSGGVPNMYYQTFVLMILMDAIYITGFAVNRRKRKVADADDTGDISGTGSVYAFLLPAVCLAAVLLMIIPARGDLLSSAGYSAYHMLKSGQASIYYEEMEFQNWLLTDETAPGRSEGQALIPIFGEEHLPLVYMPASEDEDAWANDVLSRFYSIDKVLGVNSKAWSETYGVDSPDKIYWE